MNTYRVTWSWWRLREAQFIGGYSTAEVEATCMVMGLPRPKRVEPLEDYIIRKHYK